jgi:putative solute:sodium symporter small subunit
MSDTNARSYWKANLKIVGTLLCIWFFISFVCGILLVDFLDNFRIGGFKLGFWMAQQGSIYGFVVLIFVYIRQMDKLDQQYNLDQVHKQDTVPTQSEPAKEQGAHS